MGLTDTLKQWSADFLGMIYPECCEVCGCRLVQGEKVVCTGCDLDMPRCNIHNDAFNTIHQRLASPNVMIQRAAGYFYYYRDTPYTRIIHAAKYNSRPRVGRIMAERFAREIMTDGFFNDIDLIVPVPIHWRKKLQRGYNQSVSIARGLSLATGIKVVDNLVATKNHYTQTRKNAYERWDNSRDVFSVKRPDELEGKHLLVVDDVITTGATMVACCEALNSAANNVRLSVLSLGVTTLQ